MPGAGFAWTLLRRWSQTVIAVLCGQESSAAASVLSIGG